MDMTTVAVNSSLTTFTRYIATNAMYGGVANNSNSSVAYQFPLFYYGIGAGNEYNASFYHKILSSQNNESDHYTCPSIQMPVGSLISMILYAIVCIVGLFGNTLVIYVVLRFSKMQTVTNM